MDTHALSGDIHEAIAGFSREGPRFALATVLKHTGSTPQKAGAKAIIDSARAIWGTIGGGLVEARGIETAAEAIATGRAAVFDFEAAGARAEEGVPICGGTMRVLIDPAVSAHGEAYAQAAAACRQRRRGALVTIVRAQEPPAIEVQWLPAEAAPPESGFPSQADVHSAIAAEAALHVTGACPESHAGVEALIEPIVPAPRLLIVGGGHVAQALARQASVVGFEIVILEDRPEFARAELFPPGAVLHCGHTEGMLGSFPMDPDTYVAIVTRGHQHDAEALAACIRKPAAYVGMIGSRRKVAMIRKMLVDSGQATEEEFGRVHAPIGLNIGAKTVPEIAVSIVAELIAVRRKAVTPGFMRLTELSG